MARMWYPHQASATLLVESSIIDTESSITNTLGTSNMNLDTVTKGNGALIRNRHSQVMGSMARLIQYADECDEISPSQFKKLGRQAYYLEQKPLRKVNFLITSYL